MKTSGLMMMLTFTCAIAQAQAHRWIPIGSAADGTLLFMERPVVEHRDLPSNFNPISSTTTWVKVISPAAKTNTGTKPKFASAVQKIEFDCGKSRIAIKRAVYYDQDGEVIKEDVAPNARPDEPIPDSIGETVLGAVCTWLEVQKSPQPPVTPQKQSDTPI